MDHRILPRAKVFRFLIPGAFLLPAAALPALAAGFTLVSDPGGATDASPFIKSLGFSDSGVAADYTGIGMPAGNTMPDPNCGLILNRPSTFTCLNPDFSPAAPNACQTRIFGISDAGATTAGFYIDADGVMHGFVDVGEGPAAMIVSDSTGVRNQLLGPDHAGHGAAGFATNAAGASLGYTYNVMTECFTLRPLNPAHGPATGYSAPATGCSAPATGVSHSGIVRGFDEAAGAGFLRNSTATSHPAIDVPAAAFTRPLSLNDQGEVVGAYTDAMGVAHGFTWLSGPITTIDPVGSVATTLQGVNDAGLIAGFYADAANGAIGLITAVTPEPPSFLLAIGGLALLALSRLRIAKDRRRRS